MCGMRRHISGSSQQITLVVDHRLKNYWRFYRIQDDLLPSPAVIISNIILHYLILSYLILSYLILSYLLLPYLISSSLIFSSDLISSYLIFSYLILSHLLFWSHLILSSLTLSYLIFSSDLILFNTTAPYFIQSYLFLFPHEDLGVLALFHKSKSSSQQVRILHYIMNDVWQEEIWHCMYKRRHISWYNI